MRSAFFHSKWLLATLILAGLVYFEGRLSSRTTVTDNRSPSAAEEATPSSSTR